MEAAPPATREEALQAEEERRLRRALAEDGHDVAALIAAGQRKFDAGHYRIAVPIWERAEDAMLEEAQVPPLSLPHARLLLDLGHAHLRAGNARRAREILAPLPALAERLRDVRFGLLARAQVANLLTFEGKDAEAEILLRKLLPEIERELGERDPLALNERCSLMEAVLNQGRAAEAEALVRAPVGKGNGGPAPDLLATVSDVMGPDDRLTCFLLYNCAAAVLRQGRGAEAERIVRDTLSRREARDGDHPDVLVTRHLLARALLQQGRAAEAEELHLATLPLDEAVLGRDHPYTHTERIATALAAFEAGHPSTARQLLAAVPPDAGMPRWKETRLLLQARVADADGDGAEADRLLAAAEEGLKRFAKGDTGWRYLARYRATRTPGQPGGTFLDPQGADANTAPDVSQEGNAGGASSLKGRRP